MSTALTMAGGVAPYTFGLLSGSGTVHYDGTSNEALFVPNDIGNVAIQVTDSLGATKIVEMSVVE